MWAFQATLTAAPTRYWAGKPQALEVVVRVDGRAYQFLGQGASGYRTTFAMAEEQSYPVRYTFQQPVAGWKRPALANSMGWKTGPAPFKSEPGRPGTAWTGRDVWVRRKANLAGAFVVLLWHDDNAEVYLNGVLLTKRAGADGQCDHIDVPAAGRAALCQGDNVLALNCANPQSGAHLDAGLYEELPAPRLPTARQMGVAVAATQTTSTFAASPVRLTVNFLSSLLLNELETVARPVSYVTFTAVAPNGQPHPTQVLLAEAGTLASDTPYQEVAARAGAAGPLRWQALGTVAQPVLAKTGDGRRIDWGYAYLAAPVGALLGTGVPQILKTTFASTRALPAAGPACAVPAQRVAQAAVLDLGHVAAQPVEKHLLLGYDEQYAVQYFGQNLRPWWRRGPATTMEQALAAAEADYARLRQKATAFGQ
ncbi:DUF5127 domain-containing protein [Hymenobacter nivis]|uniref:DUF5127 domain-containing protein n=1 Tax=Hymenobacter nivis TaxID=1850093 RepID=UPI001FE314FE|nr:DUF5127 domain-containing protein [Hymenobacter nivis]